MMNSCVLRLPLVWMSNNAESKMQEGARKFEVIGSTRFHNTLWNEIGSDRTP